MSENTKIIVDGIENFQNWTKRKINLDISLLVTLNIIMFIVFTQVDIGEHLIEKLQKFEEFELDEIIPLFITISLSLLFYTVRRFIELKKLFAEIEQVSVRDHLTGLFNRRYIQAKYYDITECSKRENDNFAVIIIDIDDFKKINDTFGHNVGDVVLQQFSKVILDSTRSLDLVSRWGGEEFLILCPQTNLDSASSVGERILSFIRERDFDETGHLTASLGIVVANEDESFEHIVNRADKCLYKAKSDGKNCCVRG